VAKGVPISRKRRVLDTRAVLREWAAMREAKLWSTGGSSLANQPDRSGGRDDCPKSGRKPAAP
jgi:hypothetical protein